jgi:hypothetical protein
MKHMRQSEALHFSMAEFSWIILFIAIGTAAFVWGRFSEASEEARTLRQEVTGLKEDINILNELLAEKENGVVPCWRRPEGVIPPLVGTIIIEGRYSILVSRDSDKSAAELVLEDDGRKEAIQALLRDLFAAELSFSREKNCYLRIRIENRTDSFNFYQEAADAASKAGIIVVQ